MTEWFATPGKPFQAKFSSTCDLCGKRINRGDMAHYVAKKKVAHARCTPGRVHNPAPVYEPEPWLDPVLGPDDDGGWVNRVADNLIELGVEIAQADESFGQWARSL
jgi:hypothetical protein